jgi:hypothetical protein
MKKLKSLIVMLMVMGLMGLMSFGAVAYASSNDDYKDPPKKEKKVWICHKTGKGEYNLIKVNKNAVDAHLKHGDKYPVKKVIYDKNKDKRVVKLICKKDKKYDKKYENSKVGYLDWDSYLMTA